MPLALNDTHFDTDLAALLRLQSILLEAAEGARGPELDEEYKMLRRKIMEDKAYTEIIPKFIRHNHDIASLWPNFKSFSPQWEPRRVEVREQFKEALAAAERLDLFGKAIDSSAWTGAVKGPERLKAVQTLIPIARNAVELLILALEQPSHNGGPPLDEVTTAIDSLRRLHRALGDMLLAADEGNLFKSVNDGLPAEVARYAKRAAKALRDDPMPYAMSATILAILTACGVPDIGGYLTSVALLMTKKQL